MTPAPYTFAMKPAPRFLVSLAASLLAALALAISAPRAQAAVVETASLNSALAMARNTPAFQQSILTQINALTTLSVQPAPVLTPFLTPTPSAADPWRLESVRLVGALAARPEAVAAHDSELRAALGNYGADLLHKAADRLKSDSAGNTALGAQLTSLRDSLDLGDPGALAALQARLSALYEGSRAMPPAGSVAAPEGAFRKPLVGLSKSGERPAMSAVELEAYVAQHEVVSPRGLKRVNFISGDYHPGYDPELRRLGVDMIVIKTPSRAELAQFREEDSYHLKSEYVRWVMPTRSLEEHSAKLRELKGGPAEKQFQKMLKASDALPFEIGPLTAEKFAQWYPIYEDEVVGKPGGKRNVFPDFASKLAEQGRLGADKTEYYGLFYYDPQDKTKMIGGVIMKGWPDRGMFVMHYAAYRPETKNYSPSMRTFAEGMKLARSLGYKVLSLGEDTNFYGYDYNLGLMENKAGLLLTTYPSDDVVLMKVLDTAKIATVKDKEGRTNGYFFFGIPRTSPLVERYLASKEAGAPKWAEDLLGSPGFFDGRVDPPEQSTVGRRYKGTNPNPIRTPVGAVVIEGTMAAPGHGE